MPSEQKLHSNYQYQPVLLIVVVNGTFYFTTVPDRFSLFRQWKPAGTLILAETIICSLSLLMLLCDLRKDGMYFITTKASSFTPDACH